MIEKTLEIKMKVAVFADEEEMDDILAELKKLEHHIEYLVNTEDYPEINSIWGVQVNEIDE